MTDITIPPEAVEAGARELARIYEREFICDIDRQWPEFVPEARAACLAMLKAWPRMDIAKPIPANRLVMSSTPTLILPLPPTGEK